MSKPLPLPLVMGLSSTGTLLISMMLYAVSAQWRGHAEPLHSAIEAVGGLAAIAMAIVLFQRKEQGAGLKFDAVAGGFLSMGILEEFHAVASPGDGFILLRSVASFVGGVGFSLVWLHASPQARIRTTGLVWIMAAASFLFGVWTIVVPESMPEMTRNGEFSPAAVAPQSFAAMLFIASAIRFALDYRRSAQSEDYLFACLAFMFALAEVMFMYSMLWDSRWWFWHLIRLAAYLLVLGHVVRGYRRMVADLTASLAQTTRAEETLRRSEQHLRRVLEERERIGQDLHDGIIQSIFALGLNLERSRRLVTQDPQETIKQLGAAVTDLKVVIRDLRGYITGLESGVMNGQTLEAELASLVRTMEGSHDLRVALEVDPIAAGQLTPEQATHIMYIAREAVSNSLQHAHARQATVSLQRREGGVRLIVEDNGVGFNMQVSVGQGRGLQNMAARAKKLSAQFAIESAPGHGTHVLFDIPTERVHV